MKYNPFFSIAIICNNDHHLDGNHLLKFRQDMLGQSTKGNLSVNLYLNLSVKDRQQEVRAVLEALRYISDCYMPLDIQYMHYIPLITSL